MFIKDNMKQTLKSILWILILISIIPFILVVINYYSNGGTFFQSIEDVSIILGYVFLGLLIFGGIPGLIAGFMENALKNKSSLAYKIFIEINAICVLFILIIGLIFLVPNLIRDIKFFYKNHFYWFVAFVVSVLFSSYWLWLKRAISINNDNDLENQTQTSKSTRLLTLMRKTYNKPDMTELEMLDNIERVKQFKASQYLTNDE